jgi:alkylation response protein AidB-like acyl-CoA dehydrogenase
MTTIEELNEIIEVSKKFAAKEICSGVLEADLESDTQWVKSLWSRSRDIGLPGLIIPEDSGGVGQSVLCSALLLDVLASECAGLASVFAHHFAGCLALGLAGPDQKERYLAPLADLDREEAAVATVVFPSFEEPAPLCLQEKKGALRLTGTSPIIGNTAFATLFLVFAAEEQSGERITCIMIEKGTPGVVQGEPAGLPGLKVNPFMPVAFQEVEIGEAMILGGRGRAGETMARVRDHFNCFLAAMAMGTARTAYQKAFAYAQERFQYGDYIINHQEIRRLLGAMQQKLRVGTSAYLRVFDSMDLRLPCSLPDAGLAKAYCTDSALEIALDAIQIHGGYGYMHEYGVEKIMRDVKVLGLLGGSSPNQHIQATAREISSHGK